MYTRNRLQQSTGGIGKPRVEQATSMSDTLSDAAVEALQVGPTRRGFTRRQQNSYAGRTYVVFRSCRQDIKFNV